MFEKAGVELLGHETQLSFLEVVARYQKVLYHWAFELTGSREDAEDLAQDTFIKVHRAMAEFRGEAKWSTWIFKIARNTYLDRLKTARHKMQVLENPIQESTKKDRDLASHYSHDNPEQNILANHLQVEVDLALSHLSQLQREVFVLRHYQGFKIREIGEILHRSEGTIKTTLFRAIKNLRAALSHHIQASREVI